MYVLTEELVQAGPTLIWLWLSYMSDSDGPLTGSPDTLHVHFCTDQHYVVGSSFRSLHVNHMHHLINEWPWPWPFIRVSGQQQRRNEGDLYKWGHFFTKPGTFVKWAHFFTKPGTFFWWAPHRLGQWVKILLFHRGVHGCLFQCSNSL